MSWVNSNYSGFGSGVTVPGYGFILHNRGALFTLNPKSPNAIAPHKRPFNTLSAGFVMRGQQPMMAFQLMGGDMQAQGHAQVLVNMLDLGANLQAATDMARFHHIQVANELGLEVAALRSGRQRARRHGPPGALGQQRRHGRLPGHSGDTWTRSRPIRRLAAITAQAPTIGKMDKPWAGKRGARGES